ncbi:pyridoxamine 5'-phosphate oxidase family protein [Plebeiibacterium sediminum]|uniref:Pyridoxamine 5'-phosphate oxidase family protein n=1 Tax=Plebeiibacterium sediminum TaxID=2992112 RepID=A0AAE3SHN3_9BACT|nr:pyridoxamine 5'-phosphate oxidase family protein [Plebeiobacterium sediminum]MCW3789720.1 pyridoxamine 5'-phosphate oxidase family protein [Plebeiobacterium sediminum]
MKQYHLHNRPNRELTDKSDIDRILREGKFAVISMCRDNEPYIVTLSYGYDSDNEILYFHCAKKGLKLEFLNSNKNVCATVIKDKGYVTGECGHEYESVVFWGNMSPVNDLQEKKQGMTILLNHLEEKESIIEEKLLKSDEFYSKMEILKLKIEQIHGKSGR